MLPPPSRLKIISGGQAGVDRAALDFAIAHGLDHGGWCPRGRRAEDGPIPMRYALRETEEAEYAVRTTRNVAECDATVIFSPTSALRGGTALTARVAREQGKPLLHLSARLSIAEAAKRLSQFLREHEVQVLNVAGPRASQAPEIGQFVDAVMTEACRLPYVA